MVAVSRDEKSARNMPGKSIGLAPRRTNGVSHRGKRIYVDSGGTPEVLPPAQIPPVDLAILGVALPDSRKRFRAAVDRLRPRYVLPSHQDDFFASVERGFAFGKLTDFRAVARPFQRHEINSHLILLDYFRPWTIL